MKKSFASRIMALLMTVMMLLPMAAQADEEKAMYTEIGVSDVVVNYMGTELDFTGLELKLLGGVDAENKAAIFGGILGTPDTNASLAVEMGEKEMTMLLFNQLVKLPYDKIGEFMLKTGATEEDVEAFEAAGGIEMINKMWTAMASSEEDGKLEAIIEQLGKSVNEKIIAIDEEYLGDFAPEEAEFEVNGEKYEGNKVTIALNAEKGTEYISTIMDAMYGSDEMKSLITAVYAPFDGVMAASGEEVSMTDMVTGMMDAMRQVKLPDGLKLDIYAAQDGDKIVGKYVLNKMTIDMRDYMLEVYKSMNEQLDEEDIDVESFEEALAVFDVEVSMDIVGESEDEVLTDDEVEYTSFDASMYMHEVEAPFMNMYVTLDNTVDDGGKFNIAMTIDPEGMDGTGIAQTISLTADWSDKDDDSALNAAFELYEGDAPAMSMNLEVKRSEQDKGAEGSVVLNVTEGESEPMRAFGLEYSCDHSDDDDAEKHEVVFAADIADEMLTMSGVATYDSVPMTSEHLMTTSDAEALDLSEATDEQMQQLIMNAQYGVMGLVNSAMDIPGVMALLMPADTDVSIDGVEIPSDIELLPEEDGAVQG